MIGGVISTEEELAAFIAQKNGKPLSDPVVPVPPVAAHAKHAPSSADQRRACPGSRRMQELYPETEESEASRKGTAAHWAVAELLNGQQIDVGLVAPNGIMLDEEMCEAAEMCEQVVMADKVSDTIVLIEERVDISSIHEDCWGTPDYALYTPSRRLLTITDFKYGHRFVSEYENWQLIEYFEGVFQRLGLTGIDDTQLYVKFRIVQPRCYVGGSPVREWTILASDLRGYINEARAFEHVAAQPDAPTRVGPHCHDCTARRACPAQMQASASAADIAGTCEPFDLPPEALGVELRYLDHAIDILTARRSGLEEQALSTIKRGQLVPFFAIEQGYGRTRWTKPDAEIVTMGELMGVNLSKTKPVTPLQAQKAGLPESIVKMYSEKPLGELKLVPNDGSKAKRIFSIDRTVS